MNFLIDTVIAVAIQLAAPGTSTEQKDPPPSPEAAIRYERQLSKFTPAEIQRSAVLQDVQGAVQDRIKFQEQEQRDLWNSLPPEEQDVLKQKLNYMMQPLLENRN